MVSLDVNVIRRDRLGQRHHRISRAWEGVEEEQPSGNEAGDHAGDQREDADGNLRLSLSDLDDVVQLTSGSDEPDVTGQGNDQPTRPERPPPKQPGDLGYSLSADSRRASTEANQKPAEPATEATVESSRFKDGLKPVQEAPQQGEQSGESRDNTPQKDRKESDSTMAATATDGGQDSEHKPSDAYAYASPLEQKPSHGGFASLAEEFDARAESRETAQQYDNAASNRASEPGIKRDLASSKLDEESIKDQVDPFVPNLDNAEGPKEPFRRTVRDTDTEWTDGVASFDVRRHGPGIIDERAKKFDSNETKVAELLASEGKKIEARAEGEMRTSDAYVDGAPTEFKAIEGARIPGSAEHELPTDRTVKAALNSAKGQLKNDQAGARAAILDGREHGLTRDAAEQGMRAYLGQPHAKGKIDYIQHPRE
ncbi:hypothetical protein NE236_25230 [Actinoallomurus purpureus]|nr:hypothetical protein [Actinoallomurus purpureus]MCO6008285.1 hypothetical protein [Actinoallomurus purpureus]